MIQKSLSIVLCALAATGCGRAAEPSAQPAPSHQAERSAQPGPATQTEPAVQTRYQVDVYKTESCGCCKAWVRHLQHSGFVVQVHNLDNLGPVKERVGIPYGMGACHTAEVDGFFIEGHVPAGDIKRLLRERPDAKGLTVPAMPVGSPGMEVPSGKVQPYDVFLVAKDGTASVYVHHGQ